jgi:hypothetical protein
VKFRGSPAMRGSARATATSSSGSRGGNEADGAAELASEPVCDAAILPVASIAKRDIGRTNLRMCALRVINPQWAIAVSLMFRFRRHS